MKKYINIINTEIFAPATLGLKSINLKNPLETIMRLYHHFGSDSLYRNSIYLMASTAVMAFFGFFFWIIVARLYAPEQVGLATTLISVLGLISGFSTLGLNIGLIRFLPKSLVKNEKINSSFALTILASIIVSVIFLSGLHLFSPKLLFLQDNLYYILSFIIFAIVLSLNTIIESIFIAYRSAKFTLIKNLILSISKAVLPVALVTFSAYGIFASVGIASILAFATSIGLLIYYFKYQPRLSINIPAIKKISSYSLGNYIAGFLGTLPIMILPIIIFNELGPKEAGFFYIALMIANLLFIIPQATTQSLFAEGSHTEDKLKEHLIKSIKITSIILIPAILFVVLLGNYILQAFGKNYSIEAFQLLQLFAISSLFISLVNTISIVLKVREKIKTLLALGTSISVITILLSYLFIDYGIIGVGVAWLTSHMLIAVLYLIALFAKPNNNIN